MVKNLAVSAVALVLALILCELGVRFIYRDVTTTRDNRSYFALRWKRSRVRLNRDGFRDAEFPALKPADTVRAAVIGDSFTFGQGIDEDERFSNLMARELQKGPRRVEVMNFGRAGNNMADNLRVLEQEVLPRRPDFVLLQWYINDVEGNARPGAEVPQAPGTATPSLTNQIKQGMLNRFAIYFLFSEIVHGLRANAGQTYDRELFERVGDSAGAEWQAAEATFRTFIKRCREQSVGVGVVLVPDLAPISDEYPFGYLHTRTLDVCRSESQTCVDLLPVFEPYLRNPDKVRELWVNMFDTHMSALANRLAADHVVKHFGAALAH